MLNIEFRASSPINFVVLTDRSVLSAFPFKKFRGTFVAGSSFDEWVSRIKGTSDCQTVLSVDELSAIHFIILSNYYEYATAEFIDRLGISNLRALGASVEVDAFRERTNVQVEEIYKFLLEAYSKGNREKPLTSEFGN